MDVEVINLPFDVPLLPVLKLMAGDLSCIYENGNLRQLTLFGEEIVQMIYPAIRDTNWATSGYQITDEQITLHDTNFEIHYTAEYILADIHYRARIGIKGTEHNSITFSFQGEAMNTCFVNRIGLCVHHPIKSGSGKHVTVIRPDGSNYTAVFPAYVSPHQPFKDVSSMMWQTDGSALLNLNFEGEVFETEDQRNWADHSYKTYSRRLDQPYPFLIEKGSTLIQRITLKVIQNCGASRDELKDIATITEESKLAKTHPPAQTKRAIPKIGYVKKPGNHPLTKDELRLLQSVPFNHYRVALNLGSSDWQKHLFVAGTEANELNASLELITWFTDSCEKELNELFVALKTISCEVDSILPLQRGHDVTPAELLGYVYASFKEVYPATKIGYGTIGSFADLNRHPPKGDDVKYDFVNFGMQPQVHMKDTRSIIGNLQSLLQIIESTRQFTSKPIFVSPIAFLCPDESVSDRRLATHFGAAWTLLSIFHLAGADHLAFDFISAEFPGVVHSKESPTASSPIFQLLARLKQFSARHMSINEIQNQIIFEDDYGNKLVYLLSEEFNTKAKSNCFNRSLNA
jgi:D-apionolactonase